MYVVGIDARRNGHGRPVSPASSREGRRRPQTQNGERGTERDRKEGGSGREGRIKTVRGPLVKGMPEGEPRNRKLEHQEERGGQGRARDRPFRVSRLKFQQRHIRAALRRGGFSPHPTRRLRTCARGFLQLGPRARAAGRDAGLSWGPSCRAAGDRLQGEPRACLPGRAVG